MGAIFFGLFWLSAIINIVSIFFEKYVIRIITKLCIMPLLILFTIFASNKFSIMILLPLLFSWFGDIFLIKPKKMQILFGIGSFFVSHILYIVIYTNFIFNTGILFFVLSFIILLTIECFVIIKILHLPKNYQIPIIMYGIIIGLLIVFSLQVFINNANIYGFILVAGSVCFFISDAVLAYYNTVKAMTKYSLALVMASYVIAQAGIIIACINLDRG